MSRSLKCLGHRLLLAVMLLALGTAPLVVQSVAWGLMLVEYSRTSTFTAAVEMTFDGEHPCSLCREVQKQQHEGEKQQQTTPAPRDLVLYHVAGSANTRPAETFSQPQKRSHEAALLLTRTPRPPVPPPRLRA
jgi:hypothetical protein